MSLINNFDNLQNADNASGAPWFQVVLPADVATIPDAILDQIGTAITLNGGATAYNIMATVGTVQWTEQPQDVDGRQQYRSVFSFVIPKDRADVLTYAQYLNNRGVIAIVRDANGQSRLMGTVDEPATFRMASRTLGNADGQRNEHLYEIVLTSNRPVPFYQVSTHLPAPANVCPPAYSLAVAVNNSTPDYNTSIDITATPTDIIPTSYTFQISDAESGTATVTQASNVLTWTVNKVGTITISVVATNGSNYAGGSAQITVTDPLTYSLMRVDYDARNNLTMVGNYVDALGDGSGNGHTITAALSSHRMFVDQKLNRMYSQSGENLRSTSSNPLSGVTDFTMFVMFNKRATVSSNQRLISFGSSGSAFAIGLTNALGGDVVVGSNNFSQYTSVTVNPDLGCHLAIVKSGTSAFSVYKDGALVTPAASSGSSPAALATGNGIYLFTQNGSNQLWGGFDRIYVTQDVLTAAQIAAVDARLKQLHC